MFRRNSNFKFFDKFFEFLNESEKKYEILNFFLNRSDINDNDVKEKLHQILELKKEFENYRNIFESLVYRKRKLEFVESDFNLEINNIIGEIKYKSLLDNFFKGIGQYQSIKNINYEKESNKTVKVALSTDSTVKKFLTVFDIDFNKFCIVTNYRQSEELYVEFKVLSIENILIKSITKKSNYSERVFNLQNNILMIEKCTGTCSKFNMNKFVFKVYDLEFNECISKTIKFNSGADIYDYSIIVSKDSFYFYYDRCGKSKLTEIKKNLEILTYEEDVPRHIFHSNSFIASNKLFSFGTDKLNIYDLVEYQVLKTIDLNNLNIKYDWLFYFLNEENFIIINKEDKVLRYINIETNAEIKIEFKIENVNKISSFFITKNNYLAFHDEEEKIIHVLTDGSFKNEPKLNTLQTSQETAMKSIF